MIKIYGTPGCAACKNAKQVAEDHNLKYEYIDLHEGDNMVEFAEKFPGVRNVPQIVWFDKHIGGLGDFMKEIEETRNFGDGQV